MLGRVLGHYEISEKIGEGGMGEVYRARDTRLGRDIALKVLPDELAQDPERRRRFEREARAVAALKHPNIVTIHSVEEVDGVHFITMELVEGETLSARIEAHGLPLDKFFNIAVPLTDALSAAHAKGIAHRDLKPANIMFDEDGRLKILDFGLAKLFESDPDTDKTVGADSDTAEGRILGTVAYMSPEQAEGSPVDHRSDVFSMGVVLYEMATGERPFKGKNNISTISSILKDNPPSVQQLRITLPRHLGRLINRCLAKEPDRRYQSALDIRNELEGLRGEITSGDLDVPIGVTRKSPAARMPAPRLLVGAVVILALAAALVWFLSGPKRTTGEGETPASAEQPADLHSVAVLPFANLSGDENNDYFSDGLSEELMNLLAKVPGLRVAARTSSFYFKGHTGDVAEIGDQLNVATILEGSVRRAGDRVRVTAQLVKAADGFPMWSETYDRHLDDIFGIQEDIAGEVVDALKITLLGEAAARVARPRPTDNMEAYDAYLLGQQRLARRRSDALEEAVTFFQRAVDLDPDFALAYAGLAQAQYHRASYGSLTEEEAFALATPAVEKALALDDQLGEAHAVDGVMKMSEGKIEAAEAAYQRAIELNPNDAMAYMWYALLMDGRDIDKRDALLDKTLALDPLSPVANLNRGYWLAAEGKAEEALAQIRHTIEIDPDFAAAYRGMAFVYAFHFDRIDEALGFLRQAVQLDPGNLSYRTTLADALFTVGRTEDGVSEYKEIIARDPGYAPAYAGLADFYRRRGRFVDAVRWQRQALARDAQSIWYMTNLFHLCLDLDDEGSASAWLQRIQREHGEADFAKYLQAELGMVQGDMKKSEAILKEIYETVPRWVAWEVAWFDLDAGNAGNARARVAPFQKTLLETTEPVVNGSNLRDAIRLSRILQQTGEEERAVMLLDKAERFLNSRSDAARRNAFPIALACVYLLQGRRDEAIDELTSMRQQGAIARWWDRNKLPPRLFADDPRWQEMVEGIRAEVKDMRVQLAASGDLTP